MDKSVQNTDALAILASEAPEAAAAAQRLRADYGDVRPEDADVIVALGGDGLMLQMLLPRPTPMMAIMINEVMMVVTMIIMMGMQGGSLHRRADGHTVVKSRRTSLRLEH